jgi:hypothetical protein
MLVETLNAVAGLISINKNIEILMKKSALRSEILPTLHLGSTYNKHYSKASKDYRLPSYWMSMIGVTCLNSSTYVLSCFYLGGCLIDLASTGSILKVDTFCSLVLISYYEHFKKATLEEFYTWLKLY